MKKNIFLLIFLINLFYACSPTQDQVQEKDALKQAIKELEQYVKEKGLTPEEYSIDMREGYERAPTKQEIQLIKNSIDEHARYLAENPYNEVEHEAAVRQLNEAAKRGDTTLIKELEKKYGRFIKESIPDEELE